MSVSWTHDALSCIRGAEKPFGEESCLILFRLCYFYLTVRTFFLVTPIIGVWIWVLRNTLVKLLHELSAVSWFK